ncbi:N-acetylglucosamine-6-phosphate deacetylase [Janibacter corallicola]|uniref:N-acetylglucosamine-6-phosphate deacetylase n=1 Tax=Janibacter corallicola TaxID=415212 RepID=UPI00082A05A4|nr:N-acetylglucosamine-6-phosphate deacetylase [Janibacter corallicola]
MILTADRLLTPERTLAPGWVRVEGTRIFEVGEGGPPAPAERHLTGTLTPGLVDIHCHGGGGASFTAGDVREARRVADAHLAHGTTSLVASLVTDEVGELERSIRALRGLVDDGVLAGLHLEGPWLAQDFCGAHEASLLRPPSPEDVHRLLVAGGDALRMVTLAPELHGALDAVRTIVGSGVVVGVGHTDATWEQTRAAIDAGASVATHLYNQIRGLHHRRPGPIAALLEDDRVWVELISDGVHVHPAMLRLALRSAPGRIVLVTDAMGAAAAADGDYHLGPIHVQVRDGVARTPTGAIAGSTLTSAAAVRHSVASGFTLEEALDAATRAPAVALGLDDVGQVTPGRRADLVALDGELRVRAVMRAGRWVGRRNVWDADDVERG